MYYVMKQDKVLEFQADGERHYITVPAGTIFQAEDSAGPISVEFRGHSLIISPDYLHRLNDNLELMQFLAGESTCPDCLGHGTKGEITCQKCSGSGKIYE
jgi:hypothetical protein